MGTGALILGIPAVRPVQFKKLKKHERRVNRAYGGCKTGKEVRDRIIRAFLIEEQKCVKQVLAEKAAAKAEEAAPAKKDKKKKKKKKKLFVGNFQKKKKKKKKKKS